MRRLKMIVDETNNRAVYNRAIKLYRFNQAEILDEWGHYSDIKRIYGKSQDNMSWKKYRKTQYKLEH